MSIIKKIKGLFNQVQENKVQTERIAEMIDDYQHHSAEDMINPGHIRDKVKSILLNGKYEFHYYPKGSNSIVCKSPYLAGCHTDNESAVDCPECLKEIKNFKRLTDPHFKEDEDFIRPADFPSVLIAEIGNDNPWISVRDRLPATGARVDLKNNNEEFIGFYLNDRYYRTAEGLSNEVSVTHWRSREKPKYLQKLEEELTDPKPVAGNYKIPAKDINGDDDFIISPQFKTDVDAWIQRNEKPEGDISFAISPTGNEFIKLPNGEEREIIAGRRGGKSFPSGGTSPSDRLYHKSDEGSLSPESRKVTNLFKIKELEETLQSRNAEQKILEGIHAFKENLEKLGINNDNIIDVLKETYPKQLGEPERFRARVQELREKFKSEDEAPQWYDKKTIFDYLINKNYSKEIAEEISQDVAEGYQLAFKKGWEKAKAEDDKYHGEKVCPTCNGKGNYPGPNGFFLCKECGSEGTVPEKRLFTEGDEIPGPVKYKCLLCGRDKFTRKSPHNCKGGFRKKNIIWEDVKPKAENPTADRAPKKIFEKTTDFPLSAESGTPEQNTPEKPPFNHFPDTLNPDRYKETEREISDQLDKLKSLIFELNGRTPVRLFTPLVNQLVKVRGIIQNALNEGETLTTKDTIKNAPDKLVDKYNALGTLIALQFPEEVNLGEDPFDTAIRLLNERAPATLEETVFQAPEYYTFCPDVTQTMIEEFKRQQIENVTAWETSTGIRVVTMIDNGNYHLMISHPDRIPSRDEILNARYAFGVDVPNMGEILNGSDQDSKTVHLWEIRKG